MRRDLVEIKMTEERMRLLMARDNDENFLEDFEELMGELGRFRIFT